MTNWLAKSLENKKKDITKFQKGGVWPSIQSYDIANGIPYIHKYIKNMMYPGNTLNEVPYTGKNITINKTVAQPKVWPSTKVYDIAKGNLPINNTIKNILYPGNTLNETPYKNKYKKGGYIEYKKGKEAVKETEVTKPKSTEKLDIKTLEKKLKKPIVVDYKEKGGIKIKPENKGKFNATKEKTGKTTEELKNSKNPLTRKRATFAANAAKWSKKHEKGGKIDFDISNILALWKK